MVPGNEGGGVWEYNSKREIVKKYLQRKDSLTLDKDLGQLSRLECYNWELCAESLEMRI